MDLVQFLSVLDVSPTLPLDATTTTTIAAAFSIQGIFFGGGIEGRGAICYCLSPGVKKNHHNIG